MRRVSEMTQMLSARIVIGTAAKTHSSVTHDQTDQTDVMPPSVSCGLTAHSPVSGKYVQK